MYTRVPLQLAKQVRKWCKQLARKPEPTRHSIPSSQRSSAQSQQIGAQTATAPRSFSHAASTSTQQPQVNQATSVNGQIPGDRSAGWVLIVVRSGSDYHLAQIKVEGCTTDTFFSKLRSEYLRLRGYSARCFSVWCYSHCDFYRVYILTASGRLTLIRD